MIRHEDLTAIWGEDGVYRYSDADVAGLDLDDEPRRLLTGVGLPRLIPGLFEVAGRDGYSVLQTVKVSGLGSMLVIGAVPGETSLLFTISLPEAVPMVFDAHAKTIELINSTLAAFLVFLYRLTVTWGTRHGNAQAVRDLAASLEQLDPAAFSEPTSWWALGLQALAESTTQ